MEATKGDRVGRTFFVTALSAVLAAVMATHALAQLSGDAPPPPKYQVRDDGTLIIGGDVVVSCAQIGLEDPYLKAGGPEARACEAAGFGTADDDPSSGEVPDSEGISSSSGASAEARALPKTGGPVLPALLLAAVMPLAAGCLLAWRTTRRTRRAT